MQDIYSSLQQYFGYATFRPLQEAIIRDILEQKDAFVLMPTGGGKSLCFQLPSILMKGITIVISPLISLMKDQVDTLKQNGINAAYLNSSLSSEEQQQVLKLLMNNKLSLLYVAPERLVQANFLSLLTQIPINFFAVDEAHCISQWGHDFRPEYRQLELIKQQFPDKPIMALTATATPRVKQDIIDKLRITHNQIYQASFNRPNITYYVISKHQALTQALDYINRHKTEAGIIYCHSRQTVENVAALLKKEGIRALPYHAGLPDDIRRKNQEKFIREDVDVIVATIAFGMGIDKPNVRFVIHYDLPKSLEHYYQETGRAGRDGLSSECILLFSYGDKFLQERFIREKESEEERQIGQMQLQRVLDYAQSKLCRRVLLLQYFAEEYNEANCKTCDNCINPRETFNATVLTQKILSCVYRVQERFGLAYIVNVLTGSKSQKILDNNHQKLSTYGIISEYSRHDIKMMIYELLQLGYLQQSLDQYGILQLTLKSKAILLGREEVFLTKIEEQSISGTQTDDTRIDKELFQRLRFLRKQLADQANIPPYVIFADTSLQEMATYFPQTKEQFSQIYGVGQEKLNKYGTIFINAITDYCEQKDIQPITKSHQSPPRKMKITKSETNSLTVQLFREGKTLKQIAKKRDFTEETIHRHLQNAYLNGEKIDINHFVSPAKQKIIMHAFDLHGSERLAPIKEKLGKKISYTELRWMQVEIMRKI